jgi:hypothetical protein
MATDDRLGRRLGSRRAAGAQRAKAVRELRQVKAVARTALIPGTVVWAWISFPDEPGRHKTRPAVVHDVVGRKVRVHPVTSSTKASVRQSHLYVLLDDWGAAGLSRPCLVDRRIVDLELGDITSIAGCLGTADFARIFAAAGPTSPLQ